MRIRALSILGLLTVSALAAVPAASAEPNVAVSAPVSDVGHPRSLASDNGHDAGHGRHATCARTDALFCEDFEDLPTGGAASLDWGIETRDGTLTVERARRHGKVLRVHTEDNGMAFLKVTGFEAPGNSFYGRVRLTVDEFPTAPDWAHFTLIEATGTGSDEMVRPLGGQFAPTVGPDATFWGVGADGGPTGDWTNWRESAPTTEDSWQCVEFEWHGPDNRIRVWFDGVEQPDMEVGTTNHGGAETDFVLPEADTIKVGWQLYQSGTTPERFDTWLDDVAFAEERLGC